MFATFIDNLRNNPFNFVIFDPNSNNYENTAMYILANNFLTLLLSVAGILFVLMFVIGGILYITSGGDQKRTERGKKTLTYAIGGLILTILSGTLAQTIRYLARDVSNEASLYDAIQIVLNYLLLAVGLLAVLFIVIGGIRLIASRGNTEQVDKAKKTITNSVLGLLAVILSGVVLNLISYLLRTFVG